MRKPLTTSQCVVLALFWAALVFIPIVKALKKGRNK